MYPEPCLRGSRVVHGEREGRWRGKGQTPANIRHSKASRMTTAVVVELAMAIGRRVHGHTHSLAPTGVSIGLWST